MRLLEIFQLEEHVTVLPNTKERFHALKTLIKKPILAKDAKRVLSPLICTDNLTNLLDVLEKETPEKDIRKEFIDYLKVEYPQVPHTINPPKSLRDGNIEGTLSPLGHQYEK